MIQEVKTVETVFGTSDVVFVFATTRVGEHAFAHDRATDSLIAR